MNKEHNIKKRGVSFKIINKNNNNKSRKTKTQENIKLDYYHSADNSLMIDISPKSILFNLLKTFLYVETIYY